MLLILLLLINLLQQLLTKSIMNIGKPHIIYQKVTAAKALAFVFHLFYTDVIHMPKTYSVAANIKKKEFLKYYTRKYRIPTYTML